MDIEKRILTVTEEKLLNDDLLDIQKWVSDAIDGKINNCWKRFQKEWINKLMVDELYVDKIPSNKDDFVELVTARSDYKNRAVRDSEKAKS